MGIDSSSPRLLRAEPRPPDGEGANQVAEVVEVVQVPQDFQGRVALGHAEVGRTGRPELRFDIAIGHRGEPMHFAKVGANGCHPIKRSTAGA
jgi:hypothetical protein